MNGRRKEKTLTDECDRTTPPSNLWKAMPVNRAGSFVRITALKIFSDRTQNTLIHECGRVVREITQAGKR